MKQLKLSAKDMTFIQYLSIAEMMIVGAEEELAQSIKYKRDPVTKAYFQSIKAKLEKLSKTFGGFGDILIDNLNAKQAAYCVEHANRAVQFIDNKQGRK